MLALNHKYELTSNVVSLFMPVDAVQPGRGARAVDVEVHDLAVLEERLSGHGHVANWCL